MKAYESINKIRILANIYGTEIGVIALNNDTGDVGEILDIAFNPNLGTITIRTAFKTIEQRSPHDRSHNGYGLPN